MIAVSVKMHLQTNLIKQLLGEISISQCSMIAEMIRDEAKRSMKVARNAPNGPPSRPGTPPHIETGKLHAAIRRRVRGNKVIVAAEVMYGEIHEFGGRYHPKRPFLRPAAMRVRRRLGRKLAGIDIASYPSGARLKKIGWGG